MSSNLIALAMDFASYVIQKGFSDEIKNIILFGSVARGDAGDNSDIDLFVDVHKQNKNTIIKLNKCLSGFEESTKFLDYWSLIGVQNEIKLTIGELDKWKDLKPNIIANGILIYGKYKPEIRDGKHMTYFIWENIKPNSKRVLFNKQMFGYTHKSKFYDGLVQKYGGEKLGKGCIVVPLENSNIFHGLFKKHKVTVNIKKVLEYA